MIIDPLEFIGKSINQVLRLTNSYKWNLYIDKKDLIVKRRFYSNCVVFVEVFISKPYTRSSEIAYKLYSCTGKTVFWQKWIPISENDLDYIGFLNYLTSLNIKYTIVNES